MMVLGVSALYHDSAAAICNNGDIIAAAQEERFTRKKHDFRLPINAIKYCLAEAKVDHFDLDAVTYYDNPFLTLDRFVNNVIALKEDSATLIDRTFSSLVGDKLWVHKSLSDILGSLGKRNKLLVTDHHIAHAASAYYPSPFDDSVIITTDGVGEWATTTLGVGNNNKIEFIYEIDYPHSLGLLYSAFTYFCGFKVNSGDYKLMGLAPYGKPMYYSKIKENLIDIKQDGSYRLNLDYFDYYKNDVMTNSNFSSLFGGTKRELESEITKREMDIAASIQKVLEEVIILMAKHARRITGLKNLALAGGVALNCVANGRLLKENIYDDLWIQPAAGDAGGALGAALYTTYSYYNMPRSKNKNRDSQKGSLLGPHFTCEQVKKFLDAKKYIYQEYRSKNELNKTVAKLLTEGKIIGYFNGRMEFGPRALGARSIIGDPRLPEMQSKLNLKIKYRESFRPFAPSVLAEKVSDYFEIDRESPYMLIVAPVKEELRESFDIDEHITENNTNLLPVVNLSRSKIPAVTHVDYSARVQTVNREDNPDYYDLISEFEKLTGCAVIVNTSFNVRGEPIVCTPQDAYTCFMRTEMDILVIENCLLYKENQPIYNDEQNWRNEYELD